MTDADGDGAGRVGTDQLDEPVLLIEPIRRWDVDAADLLGTDQDGRRSASCSSLGRLRQWARAKAAKGLTWRSHTIQPRQPTSWRGFDRREAVTIPPLPDVGQWDALQTARQAILPNVRQEHAAERYRTAN